MSEHNRNWWAGVADITASGLNHGALKVERIHLSIADETFNILQRVPIARPWSEAVRSIHHGISRLSYRSVSLAAASLEASVKYINAPKNCKADID